MKTIASNVGTLDEFVVLSKLEDIKTGVRFLFSRGKNARLPHPSLEQQVRKAVADSVYEPKLGFHSHVTKQGEVTIRLRTDSNWQAFLNTNLNLDYIQSLLEMYNHINNSGFSLAGAVATPFSEFVRNYVDGTLAQAGVVVAREGMLVVKRAENLDHYPGYYHTI